MEWTIQHSDHVPTLFGQNRLIEYTPIKLTENNIIVQSKWFNKQSYDFKEKIKTKFPAMTLEDFTLPHNEIDNDIFENNKSLYWDFLKLYKNEFLFDNYAHLFQDVTIIKLADDESTGLLCLCILFKNSSRNIKERDLQYIPVTLIQKIEKALDEYKLCCDGAFVKTSFKSCKNQQKCTPCYDILDVLTNLVFSSQVMQSLLVDNVSLIFRKFKSEINATNEFRVYILDWMIVGICQGRICEYPEITITDEIIISSISNLWTNIKSKIQYPDCVLDTYIHNNKAELIEINSGGPWSTAGSGLFLWTELVNSPSPILKTIIT